MIMNAMTCLYVVVYGVREGAPAGETMHLFVVVRSFMTI